MISNFNDRPLWLKSRGYLHITPKINILHRYQEILAKVQNENFVARHGFFPLIHAVIKERKYKKAQDGSKSRRHSLRIKGKTVKTAKQRPLHYATHIDSMIFGYYAKLLLDLYNEELDRHDGLSECVIAYRKIEVDDVESENSEEDHFYKSKGKGTIHFAKEAFDEIKTRAEEECIVLMFDIRSFFSEIDHHKLKEAWCKILNVPRLNAAHFNVFKAATNFRYILRDDLRLKTPANGKRAGYDERKLAQIRRLQGKEAFFSSIEEFKMAIKNKDVRVYKHPFTKKRLNNSGNEKSTKIPIGIPQGLPISAVLANLYLLEFDKEVLRYVVNELGGFYRRYSDDILVACKVSQADYVEKFIIDSILDSAVEISKEKTEKYLFKYHQVGHNKRKITSILLGKDKSVIGKPLTYLGFEFYGEKALIKSANLAKFYRRMIYGVKGKAKLAKKLARNENCDPAIFRGRLQKIYLAELNKEKHFPKRKVLIKGPDGYFKTEFKQSKKGTFRTNYFSYVNRAKKIMQEPGIEKQLRNHKRIFNSAISRHLKK